MSHAVHTTHSLVLGSAPVQDADKLFWLLTEDFGLIFASAKSVREETSKLRYMLQDLAHARVSLVRGRGFWRITGAEEGGATQLPVSRQAVFGRISALVRRLMPTEEENPAVFTIVTNAYDALLDTSADEALIERLTVARLLYQLGYLSCTEEYKGCIDMVDISDETIERVNQYGTKLILHINAGLTESQL